MTRPLRSYACEDCGAPVIRPARVDRPKLCDEHRLARMVRNVYRRTAYGVNRRQVLARQRAQA